MAFPNTLFPCIPLKTDVSDEEYKLFHTIDRVLVSTLILCLGCDPVDAISVVAFVLWLERSRLSVSAVYKVVKEWPGNKVQKLADQVLGVLEWLNKPAFVSEMCCDISLIRELCNEGVGGFAYFYERRLEILGGKMEIVHEMCDKAFKDVEFEIGGGAVDVLREFEIRDYGEGGSEVSGGFGQHSREIENNSGLGIVAGPAYYPQELRNYNFSGGFGSVNRNLVYGILDGVGFYHGFVNPGPILPGVVVGPIIPRDIRSSPNYEVGSTSGSAGSTSKPQARDPIPLEELSVLLRGINVTEEETDVLYEDRTVFLTFSKGYTVTEAEVWFYFTRRFGNFIKSLSFEQVRPGVQPIYARMVAFNTSVIPLICDTVDIMIRTRYIVNGKHVWAKKYVRRISSPPPRSSS